MFVEILAQQPITDYSIFVLFCFFFFFKESNNILVLKKIKQAFLKLNLMNIKKFVSSEENLLEHRRLNEQINSSLERIEQIIST